ncbi:hypothetical protein Leryth_006771 [Lithospermum erythrorhizon]|nr:hypothetical protein Leryth_006771 [Lithospermum erythrorhizon]
MASSSSDIFIFLFMLVNFCYLSVQETHSLKPLKPTFNHFDSVSFPLTSSPLTKNSPNSKNTFLSSLVSSPKKATSSSSPTYNFKASFKYSMALIVSIPIGTPPQPQQMVLDTAEGNLVREKFELSNSQSTPPLILGCAAESGEAEGILGMNLGRLSFVSQAKVHRFSYCVPNRQHKSKNLPTGTFYLGKNPNSNKFQYIDLLTFPRSRQMPNMDPLAYTVGLVGIKIGGKRLNITRKVFLPDAGGSGQTIIDSGTQYTFLVEDAYNKVREEVVISCKN